MVFTNKKSQHVAMYYIHRDSMKYFFLFLLSLLHSKMELIKPK